MPYDPALQALLPLLQNITQPTLWYADEQVSDILNEINASPHLTVITNRYDIYEQANAYNIDVLFNDFNLLEYELTGKHIKAYKRIIYRVSKEKPLVHHLINQASFLLDRNGELIISGYKQEGIKSYAASIQKTFSASGKLIKTGNIYLGKFQLTQSQNKLDDSDYPTVQYVKTKDSALPMFYSKPGVFGWNKIDKGSEILLSAAKPILEKLDTNNKSLLDLGCGYGWIFLNCDQYGFAKIIATDNNAAAILCAKENAKQLTTPTEIVASDCANTIEATFDIILCNPPFHQGFKHSQSLTEKFIRQCKKKLHKNGVALWVVNEFIALDTLANNAKLACKTLTIENGFKVVQLCHINHT